MGRPRKPPAVLVDVDVRRSRKLAALPNDEARLGFFYVVLPEAKIADPPGQFASREHFRELAGRFDSYLDDYLRAGVLEPAGKLCPRCLEKWSSMPPRRGALVVHDWHDHQYDPRKLERQREWDLANRPPVGDEISDAISDGVSDAQSDVVSDADSRAPVRGGTPDRVGPRGLNVERRTENGISHGEDSPPSGARERVDVAALLARGWPKVTRPQRKVLDEIAARHDVTGHAFAAEAIRNARPDQDPLEAAMAADRMWQDAQRARADADEAEAARLKAAERELPWLGGQP